MKTIYDCTKEEYMEYLMIDCGLTKEQAEFRVNIEE